MHLFQKVQNVARGMVQRYGPKFIKRKIWNSEFAGGRWNFLDDTGDNSVHLQVEKYANNGSILDLGCGSGTTSIELNPATYRLYTGVDISDVAVQKARKRAEETGHGQNEYFQSDIMTYEPTQKYDVILYGDSIYYIPPRRIAAVLHRYATCLKESGVFVVRMFDVSGKRKFIMDTIESNFEVVEKRLNEQTQVCNMVFRPARKPAAIA